MNNPKENGKHETIMQSILSRLKILLHYMGVLQAIFFVLFSLYTYATFAPQSRWIKDLTIDAATNHTNPEFYILFGLAISLLMLFLFKYENLLNTILNIIFIRLNILLFAIYNTINNAWAGGSDILYSVRHYSLQRIWTNSEYLAKIEEILKPRKISLGPDQITSLLNDIKGLKEPMKALTEKLLALPTPNNIPTIGEILNNTSIKAGVGYIVLFVVAGIGCYYGFTSLYQYFRGAKEEVIAQAAPVVSHVVLRHAAPAAINLREQLEGLGLDVDELSKVATLRALAVSTFSKLAETSQLAQICATLLTDSTVPEGGGTRLIDCQKLKECIKALRAMIPQETGSAAETLTRHLGRRD